MSEKKTMTVEEITAMVRRVVADIPHDDFQVFGRTHHEEIAREYQVILLLNPNFPTLFTETILRLTAHVLTYTRHHRDDDDWGRPRKPKPEPPTPQGGSLHKILEHT